MVDRVAALAFDLAGELKTAILAPITLGVEGLLHCYDTHTLLFALPRHNRRRADGASGRVTLVVTWNAVDVVVRVDGEWYPIETDFADGAREALGVKRAPACSQETIGDWETALRASVKAGLIILLTQRLVVDVIEG